MATLHKPYELEPGLETTLDLLSMAERDDTDDNLWRIPLIGGGWYETTKAGLRVIHKQMAKTVKVA